MKEFHVISAKVDTSDTASTDFAMGKDAEVSIVFDRKLTKLEAKRVLAEAVKLVGDEGRVNVYGSQLTIRTRDFGPVREFVEVANSYSENWFAVAESETKAAQNELIQAAKSLEPLVVWQKAQTAFL